MKFSQAITAEFKSLDVDIGYLHGANECRRAIKTDRPDFLIMSRDVRPAERPINGPHLMKLLLDVEPMARESGPVETSGIRNA